MIMNPRVLYVAFGLLLIAAAGLFLAIRTIPAPQHTIEKIISNDRFVK